MDNSNQELEPIIDGSEMSQNNKLTKEPHPHDIFIPKNTELTAQDNDAHEVAQHADEIRDELTILKQTSPAKKRLLGSSGLTDEERTEQFVQEQERRRGLNRAEEQRISKLEDFEGQIAKATKSFEELLIDSLTFEQEGLITTNGRWWWNSDKARDTWEIMRKSLSDRSYEFSVGYRYGASDSDTKQVEDFKMKVTRIGTYDESDGNIVATLAAELEGGKVQHAKLDGRDRWRPIVNANLSKDYNSINNLVKGTPIEGVIRDIAGERPKSIEFDLKEKKLKIKRARDGTIMYTYEPSQDKLVSYDTDSEGYTTSVLLLEPSMFIELLQGVLDLVPEE